MLDNKGFNLWADDYDKSVNVSEENNQYPFAGYKDVLNYIYNQVRENDDANVLDIGFGTGILTTQLYNAGCNITGIDFSSNMIDIAKQKMPNATLINGDFSKGLPDEIKDYHFDYIISTYAIHHLTDKEKINFIKSLSSMLSKRGKILIGDVSFQTRNELEISKEKYKEFWDNDEFYFIAEEIKESLSNDYFCKYIKISHCAGILTIENNNFMNVLVREYEEYDAKKISNIITRNLFEVNIEDYGKEEIYKQAEKFKTEDIIKKFKNRLTYVAIYEGNVIGTASICNDFVKDKSIYWLLTVFVLPEYHKKGIGRILIEKLEQKAIELNAKKIIVDPSITGKNFYRKLGYEYEKSVDILNDEGHIMMEKYL